VYLGRTRFGAYVKAIGSNEPAAWAMGIDVPKIKLFTYTLSGLLAGLAGVLLAGRLSAGQANAGIGWELDAIAAVIIGGTSLMGGEGTVIGSLVGAALLGIIRNALVLFGVSMYWQTVVIGCILIGGVALSSIRELRGMTY
ncbi:MAG: ABC transporter permease, partial [Atribacterota bacterium]|nr:ABC transporter permease [Atribacterota bacterium]